MTTLLILDTETTGLDPKTEHVIEVGAVLYSVDHHCVISMYSELVDYAKENGAEAINHIPAKILPLGQSPYGVLEKLAMLAHRADIIVAHRAEFDKGFIDAMQAQWMAQPAIVKPWLCSKNDIKWPLSDPGASLIYVASNHGVPVVDAHRALTDCIMLAKCFYRCHELGHNVEEMIRKGMQPKITLKGMHNFAQNETAKKHGFAWNAEKKSWLRRIAKDDAAIFMATLPFPVVEVDSGEVAHESLARVRLEAS